MTHRTYQPAVTLLGFSCLYCELITVYMCKLTATTLVNVLCNAIVNNFNVYWTNSKLYGNISI